MNIYVGNLSYDLSEDDLRAAFEAHGPVDSVKIIRDRETGASKGFGFVEVPAEADANRVIEELNGVDLLGRNLVVNQARDRNRRHGDNNRNRNFSGGYNR